MNRKEFLEALATQLPFAGGIIIYKKLCDIERKMELISCPICLAVYSKSVSNPRDKCPNCGLEHLGREEP
jgi:predicted RNA-binding Zn-ribbon protein involved in translation (DUF1610 family)